jgi:molybdopterin-containing oxidoreductase family iron-sulfur binding subunit
MEKCSMCVQTIQAGKLSAKKAGRALMDGEIRTACQSACPTHSITFGDLNDSEANIVATRKQDRNFVLLEELGVKPTVSYLVKVRNQEEEMHAHHDHAAAEHGGEEKKHEEKHS